MDSADTIIAWAQLCSLVRSYDDVSAPSFDAFSQRLRPRFMGNHSLVLTAETAWVRDWVEKTYKPQILRGLKEATGNDWQVEIKVDIEFEMEVEIEVVSDRGALQLPTPSVIPAKV